MYLRPFDPWKSKLCTCPPKYSINPYTGCVHGCLYCYASSYIKNFFHLREKSNIIECLKREIKKIPPNSLISLCNTSDPYPPVEIIKKTTRKCLEILKENNMKVLIITKSDILLRDIDLLKEMHSCVTVTITTLKHYKKLEPNAPTPIQRLRVLDSLSKEGISTGIRLDPIIPMLNEEEIETILMAAKESGVKHVIASTFKPRWDSWRRISLAFPDIALKIEKLYFKEGTKLANAWYLPENLRKEFMIRVSDICRKLSLTFSSCREGFPEFNSSPSCDGSHLIPDKSSSQEQVSILF
ncbi:MAG: radical SAM protein [Thermodesulfovibrio sp.]|nr:radical SAM protein [Thermodesulfovibrio sp.]MDW7972544.1 radical SAM protein [Thermodesulfovibrio sp.]